MTEELSNKYTDDVGDDVRAAMTEIAAAEPAPEPVKSEPEKASEPAEKAADKPVEVKSEGERERDEKGRFAPKTEAKDEPVKVADKPKPEDTSFKDVLKNSTATVAAPKPTAAPPPGWSIKGKSHWDKLPQEVRDDIAKREEDISKGFSEYQGFKGFIDRAKREGQNPVQALNNLVGFEDLIRRDPDRGLLRIAESLGWTQYQAGQKFATLAQQLGFAPSNGQMAPANQNGSGGSLADQNAGADPTALRQVFEPFVSPLMQRIQQLEQNLTQQTEAQRSQRLSSANSVIEQFRQDPAHRYYDNLEETIGDLLEGGIVKKTGDLAADLAKAYEMACRLNPEISETLLNERIATVAEEKAKAAKEAADKARQASRSVTGSPSPGASSGPPKARGQSYDDDLHEDVRAAVRASMA